MPFVKVVGEIGEALSYLHSQEPKMSFRGLFPEHVMFGSDGYVEPDSLACRSSVPLATPLDFDFPIPVFTASFFLEQACSLGRSPYPAPHGVSP